MRPPRALKPEIPGHSSSQQWGSTRPRTWPHSPAGRHQAQDPRSPITCHVRTQPTPAGWHQLRDTSGPLSQPLQDLVLTSGSAPALGHPGTHMQPCGWVEAAPPTSRLTVNQGTPAPPPAIPEPGSIDQWSWDPPGLCSEPLTAWSCSLTPISLYTRQGLAADKPRGQLHLTIASTVLNFPQQKDPHSPQRGHP